MLSTKNKNMSQNFSDEFKIIPGFEDYEININGDVYSVRCNRRKIIKAYKQSKNYHYVQLYNNDGMQIKVTIQKLLLELFSVPKPKKSRTLYSRKEVVIDGVLYSLPQSVLKKYKK